MDSSSRQIPEVYFVTPENSVFSIGKNQCWEPLRALAWKSVRVWGDILMDRSFDGDNDEPILVVHNFEIRNLEWK